MPWARAIPGRSAGPSRAATSRWNARCNGSASASRTAPWGPGVWALLVKMGAAARERSVSRGLSSSDCQLGKDRVAMLWYWCRPGFLISVVVCRNSAQPCLELSNDFSLQKAHPALGKRNRADETNCRGKIFVVWQEKVKQNKRLKVDNNRKKPLNRSRWELPFAKLQIIVDKPSR